MHMFSRAFSFMTVFVMLLTMVAADAEAREEDGISWSITPYAWAPLTKVDLTFQDTSIGGEIRFKDVLDTIDAAFMVTVEGGKGRWSAFADMTYADASDDSERNLLTIRSRNKQQFIDVGISWWPGGIGSPLSVIGGLRYTGFDSRFDFVSNLTGEILASEKSDSSYNDILLGLRYRLALSERWALLTRGDASFGESDGTVMLRAHLSYAVGKQRQNGILFGYQYKQADFDDSGLQFEFRFHGPTAGFKFRF